MSALHLTLVGLGAWVVTSVPVGVFVGRWLGRGR
jgi:hypothetical protein